MYVFEAPRWSTCWWTVDMSSGGPPSSSEPQVSDSKLLKVPSETSGDSSSRNPHPWIFSFLFDHSEACCCLGWFHQSPGVRVHWLKPATGFLSGIKAQEKYPPYTLEIPWVSTSRVSTNPGNQPYLSRGLLIMVNPCVQTIMGQPGCTSSDIPGTKYPMGIYWNRSRNPNSEATWPRDVPFRGSSRPVTMGRPPSQARLGEELALAWHLYAFMSVKFCI